MLLNRFDIRASAPSPSFKYGRPLHLLYLLHMSHYAVTSQILDKVYGIFSPAIDGKGLIPIPSYALSANKVFKSLTLNHIHQNKRLDIIPLSSGTRILEELPSWVPDFHNLEHDDSTNSTTILFTWSRGVVLRREENRRPDQ
jgi:hypothetical protein